MGTAPFPYLLGLVAVILVAIFLPNERLAVGGGLVWLLLGSAFIGIANGIGVPYLNTIGSVKAGKEAATTVMPLFSAALYLGQFLSPLIVSPAATATGASPYVIGICIAMVYLLQAFLTRKTQMLPG